MKHTFVQITGVLMVLFFGLNMFFFWIMNDLVWMSFLFGGTPVFGIGLYIEYKGQISLSSTQYKHLSNQIGIAKNLILVSAIGLLFIIVAYIQSI